MEAKNTDPDSDKRIKEYIRLLSEEQSEKPKTIKSPNKYVISLAVNRQGSVDIEIDWPDNVNDSQMIYNIAQLLHSLNKGEFKSMIVEIMADSAIRDPELEKHIQKIVGDWLDIEKSSNTEPHIKPRDALR